MWTFALQLIPSSPIRVPSSRLHQIRRVNNFLLLWVPLFIATTSSDYFSCPNFTVQSSLVTVSIGVLCNYGFSTAAAKILPVQMVLVLRSTYNGQENLCKTCGSRLQDQGSEGMHFSLNMSNLQVFPLYSQSWANIIYRIIWCRFVSLSESRNTFFLRERELSASIEN